MKQIELLESQLTTTTEPLCRVHLLNEVLWVLAHQNLARSGTMLEEIDELFNQITPKGERYQVGYGNYVVNRARLDTYHGQYERALQRCELIFLWDSRDAHTLIHCKALEIAAISYIRLGKPSEALRALMRAHAIAQELADFEREANIHNSFAILYVNLGKHQEGACHFEKSLAFSRFVGDQMSEARALINLCMSYRDLQEFPRSLQSGQQGLAIARQLQSNTLAMWALSDLANTYFAIGDVATAFTYFQQAAAYAELGEAVSDHAPTMLSMARAFFQEKEYDWTQSYATLVIDIGKKNKQPGLQFEAHELLAAVYKAKGDFEQALYHFEQFHNLKEYIFNKEADEKLKQLEVAHRTENAQRDAEIYQLRYVELEREITEREHAQKALLLAQKLDSLGILAGGVAHDFNNLLATIMGHIELAMFKLGDGHSVHKNLQQAGEAIDQAVILAQKMLAFSGRGLFHVEQCAIDEYIAENQAPWQSMIDSQCHIAIDLHSPQQLIEVDKSQFEQLMINLIVNAEEAGAQTITLQTAQYFVDENDTHFWQYTAQPLQRGSYLLLRVMDDGLGMDPATVERMFDPFFTTKFVGRGLGMAASLGIIRGHRGGIAVDSQPNQGTIFEIVLPTVVQSPQRPARCHRVEKRRTDHIHRLWERIP